MGLKSNQAIKTSKEKKLASQGVGAQAKSLGRHWQKPRKAGALLGAEGRAGDRTSLSSHGGQSSGGDKKQPSLEHDPPPNPLFTSHLLVWSAFLCACKEEKYCPVAAIFVTVNSLWLVFPLYSHEFGDLSLLPLEMDLLQVCWHITPRTRPRSAVHPGQHLGISSLNWAESSGSVESRHSPWSYSAFMVMISAAVIFLFSKQ